MKASSSNNKRGNQGYTLLEMTVSLAIFSVLGYTVVNAVQMAHQSHRAVVKATAENRDLRRASTQIVEEMTSANINSIALVAPVGGNHTLTFQLPVMVGGVAEWGVKETTLSTEPDEQSKANWSVCYTVINTGEGGDVSRSLVRQILDETNLVQRTTIVAEDLRSGAENPIGFSVVRAGDVWEMTITTEGNTAGDAGRSTVFHVKTRN